MLIRKAVDGASADIDARCFPRPFFVPEEYNFYTCSSRAGVGLAPAGVDVRLSVTSRGEQASKRYREAVMGAG